MYGGYCAPSAAQAGHIARRSIAHVFRQPVPLVAAIVFPLFLLAVNVSDLHRVTRLPGFPTHSYLSFALAFVFIQGALYIVVSAGTDLARDIESGFLNRLALTRISRRALLVGLLAGPIAMMLVEAVAYLVVGLLTGAHFATGAAGLLVILGFSLLLGLAFGALGLLLALRTGSGEVVQAFLPLLFAVLFLSSMSLPRALIHTRWFRDVATYNPISYLVEAVRSLVITGWDARALALGFGIAAVIALIAVLAAGAALNIRAGTRAGQGRVVNVSLAVGWRATHNYLHDPTLLVPSMIFPLFFFAAFAGGLSTINGAPGFGFPAGYTAFQFVYVLLQAVIYGGVFTGVAIAMDLQSGFTRRFLLAAPNRMGIVLGYVFFGLIRGLVPAAMVVAVALVIGMRVSSPSSSVPLSTKLAAARVAATRTPTPAATRTPTPSHREVAQSRARRSKVTRSPNLRRRIPSSVSPIATPPLREIRTSPPSVDLRAYLSAPDVRPNPPSLSPAPEAQPNPPSLSPAPEAQPNPPSLSPAPKAQPDRASARVAGRRRKAVVSAQVAHHAPNGVDLVGLAILALLANIAASLWGLGLAMRIRSAQAAPLLQLTMFLVLFLAPVYVPLNLISGWVNGVASINPITALLEAGRGFISGYPTVVAAAFAAACGLTVLFLLWARRGLRHVERAG